MQVDGGFARLTLLVGQFAALGVAQFAIHIFIYIEHQFGIGVPHIDLRIVRVAGGLQFPAQFHVVFRVHAPVGCLDHGGFRHRRQPHRVVDGNQGDADGGRPAPVGGGDAAHSVAHRLVLVACHQGLVDVLVGALPLVEGFHADALPVAVVVVGAASQIALHFPLVAIHDVFPLSIVYAPVQLRTAVCQKFRGQSLGGVEHRDGDGRFALAVVDEGALAVLVVHLHVEVVYLVVGWHVCHARRGGVQVAADGLTRGLVLIEHLCLLHFVGTDDPRNHHLPCTG